MSISKESRAIADLLSQFTNRKITTKKKKIFFLHLYIINVL